MHTRLALCAVLALAAPALAAGANEYGGYDIAAMSGSSETPYGETRGWRVVSASVDGKFAYCAGEIRDGDTVWRLGYDGLQWQLGLPYAPKGKSGEWRGAYEVDGDSRPASGIAANGWTFMWLGLDDLDRVRNGSRVVLDIGRASIEHPLTGTAAVITKIDECVGRRGAVRAGGAGVKTLPGTGLGLDRAAALLLGGKPGLAWDGPEGRKCRWAVNETPFAGDYLLYLAAECKGRKSKLEFAGGAHFAELSVVESALAGGDFTPGGAPLVRIADAGQGDPRTGVLARARAAMDDPARAVRCRVYPGADRGYPADALVVDVSPADFARLGEEERMAGACGPFGAKDSASFWRVFQGFAWFFDLGQDAWQDIDPASLTLVTRDGTGGWKRAR